MRTSILFPQREDGRTCQVGYPMVGSRFQWLLTAAVLWLLAGVFVDGWAHNNIPDLIESFFTPWHGVLYSGFTATALVLGAGYLRYLKAGYHWRRSLPQPYLWSIAGVVIFGLAGNVDFIWHTLFGIEEDVEALLSPSHLSLAAGGVLIASSLLRDHWSQSTIQEQGRWRSFIPLFLSFFSVLSILTFFGQFANAFTHSDLFTGAVPSGDPFFSDVTLISSVLLPTTLVMSFTLALLRRWAVPFGAMTAVLFGNAVLMFVLNWDQSRPYSLILLAPLLTGLLGDIFLKRWQTAAASISQLRFFSFLFPFTLYLMMFTILINFYSLWWRIHMWLGVTFLAGLIGFGLSLLLLPPVPTAMSSWYAHLLEKSSHDESIR
jgi:hypothetical protein